MSNDVCPHMLCNRSKWERDNADAECALDDCPYARPTQSDEATGPSEASFQHRVGVWAETCFPPKVVYDRLERRDRLVEEALELAQTLPEFTADRAHALVDYVFSRTAGCTEQESGGVSVTHAALCHAEGIDQQHWAEVELARISIPEIIEKIRAKQAAKPTGSALPIPVVDQEVVDRPDEAKLRAWVEYECPPTAKVQLRHAFFSGWEAALSTVQTKGEGK